MKIVEVLGGGLPYPSARGGAVEKIVEGLSSGLEDLGHSVIVLTRAKSTFSENVILVPPPISTLQLPQSEVYNRLRFALNVRSNPYVGAADVLHIHGGIVGFFMSGTLRLTKPKKVLTIHNLYLASEKSFQRWAATILETSSARMADAITVETKWMASYLKRFVRNCRISVIPLAVSTGHLIDRNEAKERMGFGSKKVILYVGRIIPEKGLDILLQAYRLLLKATRCNDYALVIVGPPNANFDGKETSYFVKIKNVIRDLQNTGTVRYMGQVTNSELSVLYGLADVVVVPSRFEATGYVALEAMSHGTPVIASETGGLAESVKPGLTGWLFKPGDCIGLARTLSQALNEEDQSMRDRCISYIKDHHSWENVVNLFAALFEETIGR